MLSINEKNDFFPIPSNFVFLISRRKVVLVFPRELVEHWKKMNTISNVAPIDLCSLLFSEFCVKGS